MQIPGIDPEVLIVALKAAPTQIIPLGGGKNSKLYLLHLPSGEKKVLKYYFVASGDTRDRMSAEFGALEFLWKKGVEVIPQPLYKNSEFKFAILSYIEGSKAVAGSDAIKQIIDFARVLNVLSQTPEAKSLATASEASFSLDQLFENLQRRIQILLTESSPEPSLSQEFKQFTTEKLQAEFQRRTSAYLVQERSSVLPEYQRTLSPSDFGLHNALQNSAGKIHFLDFEYFGWDDPAKLLCDFVLHPGMQLSADFKKSFIKAGTELFAADPQIERRVQNLYPFYLLKWCCIILNEFVPRFRARRDFSVGTNESSAKVQRRQLTKAVSLFNTINKSHEIF